MIASFLKVHESFLYLESNLQIASYQFVCIFLLSVIQFWTKIPT